jgi:hypothetical protein
VRLQPAVVVPGLTRDQADELLAAFNHGPTSFEGRVWAAGDDPSDQPADLQEEGDFSDEDFEAASRAWARIAAQREAGIPIDTSDIYPPGEEPGERDPDLDRLFGPGTNWD